MNIELSHTTETATVAATVTKLTKATIFVELASGAAERFNRTTGKRVGGDYSKGDLVIDPATLAAIEKQHAAPELPVSGAAANDGEVSKEVAAPALREAIIVRLLELASDHRAAKTEAARIEAREAIFTHMDTMTREEIAEAEARAKASRVELPARLATQPAKPAVDDTDDERADREAEKKLSGPQLYAFRIGRIADRLAKLATIFEAYGTDDAKQVARDLADASARSRTAATMGAKVVLPTKERAPRTASGIEVGARMKLTDKGAKYYEGVLDASNVYVVASERAGGKFLDVRSEVAPAEKPVMVERKYLVAAG